MESVNINITINKNAMLLMAVVIGILLSYLVFAANVNKNFPWHPVQQISMSSKDMTSIDANGDGVVDHTNADLEEITGNGAVTTDSITVGGLTSNGAVTVSGALSVQANADMSGDFNVGSNVLFVDTTNNRVGVGTNTPSVALDVNGDVHASGNINADGKVGGSELCINGDCKSEWSSSSSLSCTTTFEEFGERSTSVYCPSGYVRTGGGIDIHSTDSKPDFLSHPINNGWYCSVEDNKGNSICYVVCCKIS